MTVYERSLFLVSSLFYQHVKESGKFKPWVLLRVTQTHEFWVMHVLIFRPLSMSNHTHTLTWITPWIEYVTFVSVVMSGHNPHISEGTLGTLVHKSGRGTRNTLKPLKGIQGCNKNGLNESFKMSPHLICLSWHFNFHIISRPDPEAGHKRDLGCQPRHIKWGLILQLSLRALSWHPWKPLRGFFCISSSPAGLCSKSIVVVANSMPSVYAALLWYNDKRISSIRPPL